MWANREATKINVALGKLGWDDAQITKWWNISAFDELGGLTPTQAWQRNDFAKVKALVDKLLSDALASEIADNPTILQRLADSNRR